MWCQVPGDLRGHVLDMRAEVAVLNRNVVLEGDSSSAAYMYGGQVTKQAGKPHSATYNPEL